MNLFDSPLTGKKLFLLACNDMRDMSEFLLNRPGRIHYHFKYRGLTVEEISGYCADNLVKEKRGLIPEICASGARISNFSYDMLRSIVFELNNYDSSLAEAQNALNLSAREKSAFNYLIYLKSGETVKDDGYLDFSMPYLYLGWSKNPGGKQYSSIVNTTGAQWTGNDDGSLAVDGEFILKPEDKDEDGGEIEKIVFTPIKEDFRARRYGY